MTKLIPNFFRHGIKEAHIPAMFQNPVQSAKLVEYYARVKMTQTDDPEYLAVLAQVADKAHKRMRYFKRYRRIRRRLRALR